ncbi:DUF456 domain-containing protein [Flavobacteriaceae bacterium XHP0103]|uniref:DUF456 domain-containing protein n=1 Tax=Marixanthotalea marina TaxID=2844359 RepID=UPI002989A4FB|nr:DUF456 domain-containing protein [Marixanthotalea marina]MBU3822009.1 DUF456 domain-containing protein [Marixanthotalea marina]
MDILLIVLGALCIIVGIAGSLLPVLPGPIISWVGLLLLYLTEAIPTNITLLVITLVVVVVISILDYIIPSIGTKRFGGTKAGIIGTSIGLVVGLFAPIPGGIIIGPFLGAFIGELINKSNSKTALKAAFGSFIGFMASTFMKFLITVIYFGLFISIVWKYKNELFAF